MKDQIFKIALQIVFHIIADLIDDGKINNSVNSNEIEKPPK